MNKVNVFVSSTCYDLSQIRADMSDFIISLGHQPFLSEFDNFPINPNIQTIENCINNVKKESDIFVLIIGNRYGSLIESGHSITNLEFLTAKNKNIPIYTFIDKKVLTALSFWKSNKNADFNNIVDNVKIFEFIEDIRENHKLWSFEFEKSQDIISILKTQISYLFKESLNLRVKLSNNKSPILELPISNKALNIVLERDDYFEVLFIAQTLVDEISKYENIKNDYKYGISLHTKIHIDNNDEIIKWLQHRSQYILNLVNSVMNLFRKPLKIYFGEIGVPSDLKGLYYVSNTYGKIFESIINWTIETSATNVPEECIELRDALSKFSSKLIEEMWDYPFKYHKNLEEWKAKSFIGAEPKDLQFNIEFKIDENVTEEFNSALIKFS
ncbi:DUF4062 domain-containing protein [Flavobacterium sp.]|uniref:DUF4062 domain-containing protein n=1 Tax=Flavobacterium sp. TaxID=239 RepID=UPI00374FE47E